MFDVPGRKYRTFTSRTLLNLSRRNAVSLPTCSPYCGSCSKTELGRGHVVTGDVYFREFPSLQFVLAGDAVLGPRNGFQAIEPNQASAGQAFTKIPISNAVQSDGHEPVGREILWSRC